MTMTLFKNTALTIAITLLAIVVSAALLTRVHERRLSHVQLLTVAEQAERKASGLWVALQQARLDAMRTEAVSRGMLDEVT